MKLNRITILVGAIVLLVTAEGPHAQPSIPAAVTLMPTSHPRLPREISLLWLAPTPENRLNHGSALAEFLAAVKLEVNGEFAKALTILSQPRVRQGPLGQYAEYYKGLAELRLGRAEEARRTFRALRAHDIVGYLAEAAAIAEAECDESLGEHAAALDIYEHLSTVRTVAPPDDLLMRVGRAARAAGDADKATRAFARVYYEFPLGDYAGSAGAELDNGPITAASERYRWQLHRAARMFAAKRYDLARSAFEGLRDAAQGDDRELVSLRLAECDYFLKRPRTARDHLRPYLETASRQTEVLYFHAVIARALGESDEYIATSDRLATEFAADPWTEEALNERATHEIRQDEDEKAADVFRDLYERFPTGRYAERAAWKFGWWAYRNERFGDAVRVFEKAASDFPRSDYRPAWLYWSGRAHEAVNAEALAELRFRLVAADYLNTYYGRLAVKRLTDRGLSPPEHRLVVDVGSVTGGLASDASPAVVTVLPPNAPIVRALLGLELYDQALDELRYAQKVWGDSSVVQATSAWVFLQQGRSEIGTRQFALFRSAINGMKRAYPQFMAAGGEDLPPDVLKIIFPMAYWDLIRKYAAQFSLDPYLAAALIAQESTFVPDIRSPSNAVGLTQLLPSTARQYARMLKLRYSSRLLTNPEANVRIGMTYLADKIREFGEIHLALASYNAGERPVHRWMMERPGLEQDEFIDAIPYPQTQNYVKKILGTAEDYRRLYGSPSASAEASVLEAPRATRSKASTPKAASATVTKKKKARRAA